MGQASTDQRRAVAERNVEAILDAVEALLERRAQPSIAAVATQAGVSRVTVYAHFATREELLEAVVARAVQRASAALDAARPHEGPPAEALDRLVVAAWHELDRHRAIAAAGAEHLGREQLLRAHQPMQDRVLALVERGRRRKAFRTDLPPSWLVTTCFALMHACGDEVRAGRLDADAALAALTTTMRDVFGARG